MAETAREDGQAQLAASVCVERFMAEPDAKALLADLKEESVWSRDDIITKGGWVKIAGMDEPVPDAADVCAQKLAAMDASDWSASSEQATKTQ